MSVNIGLHVVVVQQPPTVQQSSAAAAPANMLHAAVEHYLQRVAASRSASTMNNYLTAIRSFASYLGADIPLHSLTPDTLLGYERWLRQRGVSQNTASCYMRSLRSVLSGIDEGQKALFSPVFTGKVRTVKRSVPIGVIARLQALELQPHTILYLARDIFLFCFYAMGMPFVDVAHLRWSQLVDDTIVYHRQKTGQRVAVALEPVMLHILDRYRPQTAGGSGDAFVFPLLTAGTDHEYQIALGRYNRALHRLEKAAQLDVKLTSYVARHTWASTAYQSNVDLAVISKALGHTNPQTTLTYIRELDDARLAEANKRIIGLLDNDTGKERKP